MFADRAAHPPANPKNPALRNRHRTSHADVFPGRGRGPLAGHSVALLEQGRVAVYYAWRSGRVETQVVSWERSSSSRRRTAPAGSWPIISLGRGEALIEELLCSCPSELGGRDHVNIASWESATSLRAGSAHRQTLAHGHTHHLPSGASPAGGPRGPAELLLPAGPAHQAVESEASEGRALDRAVQNYITERMVG